MHKPIEPSAYALRPMGAVNWIGLWTLYRKEVHRFVKVILQTVFAPAVTTILFFAIFMLALGGDHRTMRGLPFAEFLVPGLVMMAIVQNSFANTSSSLLIAKVQGNIVDLLMPPLSAGEMVLAFVLGGVTRGILVAFTVALPLLPFVELHLPHPFVAAYFALAASMMLSLMGLLGAVWATKFDHMAAVTNFVIMPLSFLSGTFYSIERLPPVWQVVSHFNPFFYAIDGLRYSFIGHADSSIALGMGVMLALNVVLYSVCYWVFRRGYRLKD